MDTLLDSTHKLKLYLTCNGLSAAAFARSIGYTPQMVSGYLNGSRKMSRRCASIIENATNGFVSKDYILKYNPEYDASQRKKKLELNPE